MHTALRQAQRECRLEALERFGPGRTGHWVAVECMAPQGYYDQGNILVREALTKEEVYGPGGLVEQRRNQDESVR